MKIARNSESFLFILMICPVRSRKISFAYLINLRILSLMECELKWQCSIQSPGDFITNMRYDEQTDILTMVHEKPKISIVRNISDIPSISQENTTLFQAESNIYDALIVSNCMIVSNRNMPVRLYSLPKQGEGQLTMQWITFNDRKPNSEQYLFPLQFCKQDETIIGGGKKFMSQYDCVKNCVTRRFKEMNKRYISAVELINPSLVVAGQFDGQLSFLDLRTEDNCQTIKPHLDLVSKIKKVPKTEHQLITLARKDNFTYLWDCRKLDTFLNCYEQPLYGNQRTGLDLSPDGKTLYLGDETGNITGRTLQQGKVILSHSTNTNRCIGSICSLPNSLLFTSGQRQFPFQQGKQRSGIIGRLSFK